jgi:hypothetical protein
MADRSPRHSASLLNNINTSKKHTHESSLILVVTGLCHTTRSRQEINRLLQVFASLWVTKLETTLLQLLLLRGEGHGDLNKTLLVLTRLVTPSDVLVGGLVQMVLDVMESVLGDVCDTCLRVLPDISLLGHKFSSQDLQNKKRKQIP